MTVLPSPLQAAFTPYAPETGNLCKQREYYEEKTQMCCSMCPPGEGQPLGRWPSDWLGPWG